MGGKVWSWAGVELMRWAVSVCVGMCVCKCVYGFWGTEIVYLFIRLGVYAYGFAKIRKGGLQIVKSEEEAHKLVLSQASSFTCEFLEQCSTVTLDLKTKKSGAFGALTLALRHDMMYRT